jgi:plasmid stabilization system protein ParE
VRIVWSPVALQRVEEIVDHVSSDRPGAAREWAEGLFDLVDRLRAFPDRGRIVPELGQPSIRELIYGDYRVVYKIEGATIGVLTVRHGRRQFEVSEPRRSARA